MEQKNSFERYVIFQVGTKQYHGLEGKTVAVEKLDGNPGDTVEFNEVLVRKTAEDKVEIGTPFVQKAVVKASIVKQDKNKKIIVFRFKRRKKYRVKKGHRQPITVVRIEAI